MDESVLDTLKFEVALILVCVELSKKGRANDVEVLQPAVRTVRITQGYNKIRTKESLGQNGKAAKATDTRVASTWGGTPGKLDEMKPKACQ